MLSRITALVRRKSAANYADGDGRPVVNNRGDLCITQGLPPKAELVRLGDSWATQILTASAFTFVNAWPTTRSELQLYNGDPEKSYVIDSAWIVSITSQAAAQPYVLLAQNCAPGVQAAGSAHASIITSLSGKTGYTGRAIRSVAVTTAVANSWQLIGNAAVSPMTTNLANGLYVDLFGMYIVPPGGSFNLAGVAGTAAGTAICGVTWHETLLPLAG